MNQTLEKVFRGKVVNKERTINRGVDEFPRYVLECLIDNYCSEETFHADMEKVVRRLNVTFENREVSPLSTIVQNSRAEHGMLTADLSRCSSRPAITVSQVLRDEHLLAAHFRGR